MRVKDWLGEFVEAYWPKRFGHAWPGPDSSEGRQTWSAWMTALIDLKAGREEVELAANRLEAQDIAHAGHALAAIVQEVQTLRREPSPTAPASDRESAVQASRGCEHCGGSGLAHVYDPRSRWGEVNAHCVCPMGRWMRSKTEPETLRRIPDFAETLAHRSRPESERIEEAARVLVALDDLGWELSWDVEARMFRFERLRPDAPSPGPELSARLRLYRPEIYGLLGEPLDEGLSLDMKDFRDVNGKFDWRAMVAATMERTAVPF